MANTKDLRNRISSVKNTQQITKAMKMVSAAKLRRAQQAIINARPYALRLRSVISKIAEGKGIEHRFFRKAEKPQSVLFIVLTSDRGLCGSFNSSIIRFADKHYKENKHRYQTADFFFIGRRAAEFFKRRDVEAVDVVVNLAKDIKYGIAQELSTKILEWFATEKYDEVQIIYNEFKSAISQKVTCETLLPLNQTSEESASLDLGGDLLFEPNADEILDQLLEKHFSIQIYRCMQESIASEHGARMNAMENATKNAGEMIRVLTLSLNKIRQAAITTELIEITSGAEALQSS